MVEGAPDPRTGVATLSRTDMFAEKLLANADRWNEKSVASRDIIDLAMMVVMDGAASPPAHGRRCMKPTEHRRKRLT